MTFDLPVRDPLLFLSFFTRTLRDQGSCGCAVAQTGSGLGWRGGGARDTLTATSTGRLVVTNEAALEAVTDFTFVCQGLFPNNAALQRIFSKRDAGGTQLEILVANTTQIQMFDGAATSAYDLGNWQPVRTFAIRQQSGQKAELFLNGAFNGLFNVANTITADDADISILNLYNGTQPCFANVSSMLWYGSLLTAQQIAETHGYLESRISPRVSPNRQYWDRGLWVPVQQLDQVGGWDLGEFVNGTIADKSGGGNHLTAIGHVAPVVTEVGTAARFDGVGGSLGGALISQVSKAFDFSLECLFTHGTIDGNLLENSFAAADRVGLNVAAGTVRFGVYNGVAWSSKSGAIVSGVPTHVVAQWESGSPRLWMNGVEQVGVIDAYAATAGTLILGASGLGGATHFGGDIHYLIPRDVILTEAEIQQRYAEIASTVLFHETWELARPAVKSSTAGMFVDGTRWQVVSGEWIPNEDKDGPYLECVSNGKVRYVSLLGANFWNTKTFEQKNGAPTLTKNTKDIEIDGVTGDKIGEILLTLGSEV